MISEITKSREKFFLLVLDSTHTAFNPYSIYIDNMGVFKHLSSHSNQAKICKDDFLKKSAGPSDEYDFPKIKKKN